jgi:hypothetical protein
MSDDKQESLFTKNQRCKENLSKSQKAVTDARVKNSMELVVKT